MRTLIRGFLFVFVVVNVGCIHAQSTSNRSTVIAINDGDSLELPMEVSQREIAGAQVRGYAYGGSIPGPIIKARQGSQIKLLLSNKTDLDTTLHPHGIRLDNKFDGIPAVTQPPIKPGERFEYVIKFPDPGVYWYHPHVKDWFTRELGAYGAFLVTAKDPNYFGPANREEILVLSDITIDRGRVQTSDPDDPRHVLMGRFGNTLLVNGETDYRLTVQRGDVVRFYILNAADVRPFNFHIDGVKMKVVGSDIGKSERETWSDSVLIGPAERYIVEALFAESGEHSIINKAPGRSVNIGSVIVSQDQTSADYREAHSRLRENDDMKADIDSFRRFFDKPIDKKLIMSMSMKMGSHAMSHEPESHEAHAFANAEAALPLWERTANIEWEDSMPGMNASSNLRNVTWKLVDPATRKENMDIQWEFFKGDVVKIELFNDPKSMHPMQHPIHFHGQRFLVLSINGQANPILQWKDTVFVRPGDRMQILLDASNPGDWMFHCHIGRHSVQQGHMMTMMGNFRVKAVEANHATRS